MQQLLTMWHGLLRATSGKLVPKKCFWYLVNFKWQNQQWKYKMTKDIQGQITGMINQNKCITIPCLEPSEACCTLGVRLAPDGNNQTEAQYLWEVEADWSRTWQGQPVTWMPNIVYDRS